MKVTHAIWEKRNMGVDCYELSIEPGDTIEDIRSFEREFRCEYAVVKVPTSEVALVRELQALGYYFVEMLTQCHCDNNGGYMLSPIQRRLLDRMTVKEMDAAGIEVLYRRIRAGLFATDRVSIDMQFTKEQAANRYVGWIKDEMASGGRLYEILYSGKPVGFFGLRKPTGETCLAFLGAVYPKYQRLGIGPLMNYLEMDTAKSLGAKKTRTAFSSNNRGAYSVHLSMNYVLDETHYVFAKHWKDG